MCPALADAEALLTRSLRVARCVEGQPTTAARLLLGQLDAAGSTHHYHGDFDWPGVTIANFIIRAHGARA